MYPFTRLAAKHEHREITENENDLLTTKKGRGREKERSINCVAPLSAFLTVH